MGAYIYCDKCGYPGKTPAELTSSEILMYLFGRENITCTECEKSIRYHPPYLIEEIAERLDKCRDNTNKGEE